MDDLELQKLLFDLESDRVERKPSISSPKDIRHTICAFANDLPNNEKPGIIFIGANDDGSCSDLEINDDLLKSLADLASDGITPPPVVKIEKKTLSEHNYAVMIVKPSVNTPVKCTGVIYVRVGPTIRLASSEHELRLTEKRQSKDLPYDLRPVNLASINELDEVLSDQYIRWFDYRFLVTAIVQEGGSEIVCNLPVRSFAVVNKDILKENSRSKIDQLKSLKLIDSTGNAPTVFGLLLCSTNATKYIPGAYIQFLRIDDTSDENIMERIIDKAEIYGTVVQQIVGIEDKFKAHNKTRYSYLITPAVTKNDYPKKAFEQAIRNAILHRTYENSNAPVRIKWYNDRIEIMSPGGPYGNVTRERFGEPGLTDYRNPNLAEALSLLGYVQKFGSGLGIIRNAMSENGNPEPEFVAKETTVHVTLKSTQQPS